MRRDPVLRVAHALVLVPICVLLVDELDVRPLVEELLLPGRAATLGVRVAGRSHQHYDLRVLRDLLEPELGVFSALLVGIGVDVWDRFVVKLRVGRDELHALRYRRLGRLKLDRRIVGLNDRQIELVLHHVLDQRLHDLVLALPVEDGQRHVGKLLSFRDD